MQRSPGTGQDTALHHVATKTGRSVLEMITPRSRCGIGEAGSYERSRNSTSGIQGTVLKHGRGSLPTCFREPPMPTRMSLMLAILGVSLTACSDAGVTKFNTDPLPRSRATQTATRSVRATSRPSAARWEMPTTASQS